jgi:hypothetical protein
MLNAFTSVAFIRNQTKKLNFKQTKRNGQNMTAVEDSPPPPPPPHHLLLIIFLPFLLLR